jgi:hypothetical protein
VVVTEDADGGTVLLHLPSGTYLSLDRSAARIVRLLGEDPDPLHAAQVLSRRFDVPLDRTLTDVQAVIDAVGDMSASRTGSGRRPTVAGVASVLRSWWRLPAGSYRLAAVQATLVVMVVEVGLRLVDLDRLSRWMQVPLATDPMPAPASGPDDLTVLSDREVLLHGAVAWVLARWLFDGTCLRRALTFGWFVRRHRPVLRLGMTADDGSVAHAWIEFDGRAFDAQPVSGTFTSGGGRLDGGSVGAGQVGAIPLP